MCSDKRLLLQVCAFYSFTGILFMLWVGALITYQPFYITGLEDVKLCQESAFGAVLLFCCTFGTSLLYLGFERCCSARPGRRRYGTLATSDAGVGGGDGSGEVRPGRTPGIPLGMSEYEVNLEMAEVAARRAGLPPPATSGIGSVRRRRTPYLDDPNSGGGSGGGGSLGGSVHSKGGWQGRREGGKNNTREDGGAGGGTKLTVSSSTPLGPPIDLLS